MQRQTGMMKKSFLWSQLLGLVLLAVMGRVAQAGQWVLDRYEYEKYSEIVDFERDDFQPHYSYVRVDPEWNTKPQIERGVRSADSFDLWYYSIIYVGLRGASVQNLKYKMFLTVTPVYVWQGDGEPIREFWVREWGHLSVQRTHHDGAETPYTEQNPYRGEGFNIIKAYDGFDDIPVGPETDYHELFGSTCVSSSNKNFNSPWHLTKMSAGVGATEVRGETRNLVTEVEFSGAAGDLRQGWDSATQAYFKAEVVDFGIGVELHDKKIQEFGFLKDPSDPNSGIYTLPHNRGFAAYVDKNWTNQWVADLTPPGPTAPPEEIAEYEANMAKPIKPFWDGAVEYAVNMSNNLSSMLRASPPVYQWNKGEEHLANSHVVTLPPVEDIDSPGFLERQRQMFPTDTRIKDIHHNVQNYPVGDGDTAPYSLADGEWPRITKTRVEVKFGSQADFATLEARARIEWHQSPATQYRSETTFEVIDLDTGEVSTLGPELGAQTEVEQIDQYIADIDATKDQAFETGRALVEVALEGEMMVGSWFVPDEYDIALGVGGKVFKAVKAAKVAARILSTVNKYGSTTLTAVKTARQVATKSDNVIIRSITKVYIVGKRGKLPKGGKYAEQAEDELHHIEKCYFGEFCFVPGTLVDTADGKCAIESLRVGDRVWSKNESSGAVELKPITQTFERVAPSTLALAFNNGEVIETTAEHPFYREGDGFTPAGLLAIGNSIVTRAGPSLLIIGIEKKSSPATVYNFSVDDFHTYFVGNSAFWVHNLRYGVCGAQKVSNVAGKTYQETIDELVAAGFTNRGRTATGSYEKWYHPDGSRIHIGRDGRVIREPNSIAIDAAGKSGPGWRVTPEGDIARPHTVPEEYLQTIGGVLW